MVPRDIALKFGVVNAEALISGVHDNASISTVNGDLVIDSMRGDIQINSVSGEISVRNHVGRVSVHSVNGDITASGEVQGMTAEVVTGDVFLDVTGIPDELRLSTVSGNITARLDADVPVSYTINTVAGRLQLDDSEITGVRGRYTGKYGALDGRWLDFRGNTVTGNVSVLHTGRAVAQPTSKKKTA
jgi:DUF4097 and DUF4098 domain-containing protein YvlB